MESLESILKKIEELRVDLSAEILVQKEEGHIEEENYTHSLGRGDEGRNIEFCSRNVWVVDKPRIAEPDIQKREFARVELQRFFDSGSCSVRYMAGRALGVNKQSLVSQIRDELNNTSRNEVEILYNTLCVFPLLNPDRLGMGDEDVRRYAGEVLGYSGGFILGDEIGRRYETVDLLTNHMHLWEDIEKLGNVYREGSKLIIRETAKRRLKEIVYRAVKFSWSDDYQEKGRMAGEELGYSKFRISLTQLVVKISKLRWYI